MRWIGERIRDLRLAKRLSREAIGHRYYIAKLESGKLTPGLLKLEHIAERLGVEIRRFLVSEKEHKFLLLMEDPFVIAIRSRLDSLSSADKKQILKVLAAAPKKGS